MPWYTWPILQMKAAIILAYNNAYRHGHHIIEAYGLLVNREMSANI